MYDCFNARLMDPREGTARAILYNKYLMVYVKTVPFQPKNVLWLMLKTVSLSFQGKRGIMVYFKNSPFSSLKCLIVYFEKVYFEKTVPFQTKMFSDLD